MATSTLTLWRLPAETREWVGPVTVQADGTLVNAFQMTLSVTGSRPLNWVDPTVLEGHNGLLIGLGTPFPLAPYRRYTVWVRYTDVPEQPVVAVGTVRTF